MKYSKKKQGGDKAAGWKNTGNIHREKYWGGKKNTANGVMRLNS